MIASPLRVLLALSPPYSDGLVDWSTALWGASGGQGLDWGADTQELHRSRYLRLTRAVVGGLCSDLDSDSEFLDVLGVNEFPEAEEYEQPFLDRWGVEAGISGGDFSSALSSVLELESVQVGARLLDRAFLDLSAADVLDLTQQLAAVLGSLAEISGPGAPVARVAREYLTDDVLPLMKRSTDTGLALFPRAMLERNHLIIMGSAIELHSSGEKSAAEDLLKLSTDFAVIGAGVAQPFLGAVAGAAMALNSEAGRSFLQRLGSGRTG